MKKIVSLIKASMTSGMSIFKVKAKTKKNQILIPIVIGGYLMFMVWGLASSYYEKLSPMHLQYVILPLFVLGVSFMTFVEGIYKTGSLIYNCKDDDLLLSLPIPKQRILFLRIFKFYVFELLFNTIFILPAMIAYVRWAEALSWTYFLSSLVMLFFLPIIPIVLSCIAGTIQTSFSSRFKYKNAAQIILSMIILMGVLLLSYQADKLLDYITKHAATINELITKIYYPAGVYAKLISDFQWIDLGIFILINIALLGITIYLLSLCYFQINTRMKKVSISKSNRKKRISIHKKSQMISMIKKEINTFFKTPVFIINSGFALVLYIVAVIGVCINFDKVLPILTSKENGLGISLSLIQNNYSVMILILLSVAAYMTSMTNSMISLEGKNINILKSLPIKVKTILLSKIYACLLITTPVFLLGNVILMIRFNIKIVEGILLIILSILIPLVSHWIGLIMNLKFPKLDYENASEVVKQSTSSFLSVMIGMILAVASVWIILNVLEKTSSLIILIITTLIYIIINGLLYLYLIKNSTKEFNQLNV